MLPRQTTQQVQDTQLGPVVRRVWNPLRKEQDAHAHVSLSARLHARVVQRNDSVSRQQLGHLFRQSSSSERLTRHPRVVVGDISKWHDARAKQARKSAQALQLQVDVLRRPHCWLSSW